MTLRYLPLVSGVLLTTLCSAQRVQPITQPEFSHWEAEEQPWYENPNVIAAEARAGGDIIFSDDFANGLAGNNGLGAWTVSGADGSMWMYDTDGPNGDFSSTAERIQSESVANGFMIFDSNLANNACVSCTSWEGYLISPVMDLSATPFAQLEWTQRLRWCCAGASSHFVDVSLDGGATWPASNRITAIRDQYVNLDIGTYTMRVNLNEFIAGNASNVRIRWAHDGGASNMTHYHWQIDDVRVLESYGNDVGMLNPRIASFVPQATDTDVLDYTVYPYSQLRPLSLGSPVRNEGSNTANNVSLALEVRDASNAVVFTASPNASSIAPSVVNENLRADFTPPAAEGVLTVSYNLSMSVEDERLADNTAERSFRVSPSIYAYDNGSRNGQYDRAQTGGSWPEYHAGNLFYIENDAQARGVQIALARGTTAVPGTQVGAIFDGVIYRFDTDPPQLVAETDIQSVASTTELTPTNGAIWYNLDLLSPVLLEAGVEYAVCVRTYGGELRTRVATAGFARPVSSVVYHPNTASWFTMTGIPMVRLSFASFAGIEDIDATSGVGLGQSFPNPATSSVVIPYELTKEARVSLELHDVSGKLVMGINEGRRAAGEYRVDLSTEALQEGVYFYSLIADGHRVTKRMTVIR